MKSFLFIEEESSSTESMHLRQNKGVIGVEGGPRVAQDEHYFLLQLFLIAHLGILCKLVLKVYLKRVHINRKVS